MRGWWVGLQRKVEKWRVANGLDGKKVKMAHMRGWWMEMLWTWRLTGDVLDVRK
ncbi:hypothetical protein PIB30_099223, partial [Stylosanthes scabra]|nr:hypothetical protein [Stylosanthes scabra]